MKKLLKRFWKKFWKKTYEKLNFIRKVLIRTEKKIQEQNKKIEKLSRQLSQCEEQIRQEKVLIQNMESRMNRQLRHELERRDIWKCKAAEIKRLAAGRKIWVIKSMAPDSSVKYQWGDYIFALSLKEALEKQGLYVVIDCREDWYCNIEADVVLALAAGDVYRPDRRNESCKYILWHTYRPYIQTKEEYELYDLVFVSSESHAKKMAAQVSVPVKPLLLCADTSLFYPKQSEEKYDVVFVGNTRWTTRECVHWCHKHNIPLHLWGVTDGVRGWKNEFAGDTSICLEGFVENHLVPDIYRSSRIILNDHFDDMRECGFMNNKLVEGLFCGKPVLSDYSEDYEKQFGDCVVFYHSEEDFIEKLHEIEDNYDVYEKRALRAWENLREEFSFETRAKQLIEAVEYLK